MKLDDSSDFSFSCEISARVQEDQPHDISCAKSGLELYCNTRFSLAKDGMLLRLILGHMLHFQFPKPYFLLNSARKILTKTFKKLNQKNMFKRLMEKKKKVNENTQKLAV